MAQDALDRIAESDALDRLTVESSEPKSIPTFGSEVKNQLSSTARGSLATFSRPERVFPALWGGVKAPFQTLFGNDLPIEERLPLSILSAMGADPYRVKQLHDEGHKGAEIAAALTLPAVNAGLAATIKKIAGSSLPPGEKRIAKLTAATGPGGSVDVPLSYKQALGEISNTVKAKAVDPAKLTVRDFHQILKDTNGRLETQYQTALAPIATRDAIPVSVSDAIKRKITDNLSQTPEGSKIASYLRRRATDFEKPWTYQQLNQERMRLFEKRTGLSKENLAPRSNGEILADRAAEDALRELLYKDVDRAAGVPVGSTAKLKETQSHLIDLSDLLQKRVADLSNKAAIRKGTPLLQQENVSTYGHPAGRIGMSIHRLQDVFGDAQKRANQRVRESFNPSPRISKKGGAVLTWLFGREPETEEEREEYTPSPRGTLRAP